MTTKRQEQKERSRAKVIAAATKLFRHNGYDDVTVRDIAKAVGSSTGMVFAHFKGKADLFEACTGHKAPDAAAFLARLVPVLTTAGFSELASEAERLRRHLIGNHA